MKMELTTYKINSESEFQRITSALDELKIKYSFRKYSDSIFPVLDQGRQFADIIISTENESELERIIKEVTNSEPQRIKSDKSKTKLSLRILNIALIVYAIAMTILFLKYWYIFQKNTDDKNNKIEWSADAQDLILTDKKTGKLASLSRDANYDLNFEESIVYSKDGIKILESKDFNEDGIYEQTFLYNLKGESIGAQFDMNNDGLHEELQLVLDNKDTLKLIDPNNDGYLEIKR